MILRHSMNRHPTSRHRALTSPNEPPVAPRNISCKLGSLLRTDASPDVMASCMILSGVAAVVASVALTAGHVVICTGKLMSRNTRPTNAGLKGFCPSPPKVILPTPMAMRAPMIIIHTGKLPGRLNPNRIPVRTALPSQTVRVFLPRMQNVSLSVS